MVLIGGSVCLNVVHNATRPHTSLTCSLPAGTLTARVVTVIQNRGELSTDVLTVGYQPCGPVRRHLLRSA